jgi:hypothetical protein
MREAIDDAIDVISAFPADVVAMELILLEINDSMPEAPLFAAFEITVASETKLEISDPTPESPVDPTNVSSVEIRLTLLIEFVNELAAAFPPPTAVYELSAAVTEEEYDDAALEEIACALA